MSDHFERAMADILQRSLANGGPDTGDVLKALRATNEDLDDNHGETLGLLSKHVAEDKLRTAGVARELSDWQKARSEECANRHRDLFVEECRINSGASTIDHAALIADAAEMAANKVAAKVEAAAKSAAVVRVGAAKDAATVLTDAAEAAPKRFTREQLVANFWLFVGLLVLAGIVSGIADQLVKLVFG